MKKELKIIGFNFTKINVEKQINLKGDIKLNSNVNILSLEKESAGIISTDSIKIHFSFILNYENLGKLDLEGFIFLTGDSEFVSEILSQWDKKDLADDNKLLILNGIIQKCSLKALELEDEVGLPFHMPLPKLSLGNKTEEKKSK